MDSSIIDFYDERSRHGQLFGREDVLDKLLGWLDGERALSRGWVLLLGSPGVGKSAILTQVLATLPAPEAPHHFIRRGIEGWDRPEVVVKNLCAQIEQRYPDHRLPDLPPEIRLGELLKRLSRSTLAPQDQRLLLVLDGLDESASHAAGGNPLQRFLPSVLPPGVIILCASRPIYPHIEWLTQRDGARVLDLDDRAWSASNEAACRAFWEYHAPRISPPLDPAFVNEAVRRAEGNLLHAVRLRDWLDGQPPAQRIAANIPHGISGFLSQVWRELLALPDAQRALVIDGLGIACAAREALPASLLGEILGWSTPDVEAFLQATRPFLLEEPAHWRHGQSAYRLYHECFREFVADKLGETAIRNYHRRISQKLATWPPRQGDQVRRHYALRHAVAHRIETGEVKSAQRLCLHVRYLEAKCRELGVTSVERDLDAAVRASSGDEALDLAAVLAAVSAEQSQLQAHPASLPGLLYNRLRCSGWTAEQIERVIRLPQGSPELRLLHGVRLGTTLVRTFLGHEKPVIGVTCVPSPEGLHLLSASVDHTLRLWSLGTGECLTVLRGHDAEITACALSPDGVIAISASADATVRLWDLPNQRCIATLRHDGRWATACAVSPDGDHIAIGFDNGLLTLWDRRSLRRVAALEGHDDYITACLVTRDGRRIISASRDASVRVWELPSGAPTHVLRNPGGAPTGATRSADEQRWITALAELPEPGQVIAASGDGAMAQWDIASGRLVRTFGAGQGRVDTCTVLPASGHIVCGTAGGALHIWDLIAARRVRRLDAHTGAVAACAATPDGRRLISASFDRSIKLWEIGTLGGASSQDAHGAAVSSCALTADGAIAISASEDCTLKVWDVATGACRATLTGHEDLVTACAISPDACRVASGARDGSVLLWDAMAGSLLRRAGGHAARVTGCAFAQGGFVVTASHDRTLRIWHPDTLDPAAVLEGHRAPIDGIAVTLDGARALTIAKDRSAGLWDLATGQCVRTMRGFADDLLACALTPDGRRAVLALESGLLEIRDLASGQRVRVITAHEQRIFGCSMTPDGTRIVSASEDRTLKLWGADRGHPSGTLHATSWFRCVAAARDVLCAGDEDGNLWMVAHVNSSRSPKPKPPEPFGRRAPGPIQDAAIRPLREILADIYNSTTSAQIAAFDAGLDIQRINMTGALIEIWQAILDEARKRKCLHHLLRGALRSYPESDELIAAARVHGVR